MWWVAPNGLTVSPDSVYYLMGAEGIRKGFGFVSFEAGNVLKPISHWPPFYSLMLVFLPPWVVNALSFSISILLVQVLVRRATGNDSLSFISALILATSPVVLKFVTFVLSDILFLMLILLLLYFLYEYAIEKRDGLLIPVGILSAILPLTRYAGLFIVPVVFAYLWKHGVRLWKNLLVSSLPILVYFLWKGYLYMLNAGETRHIVFHPPSALHVSTFFDTLRKFASYSHEVASGSVVLAIFIGILALLIFSRRGTPSSRSSDLLFLSTLTIFVYLLFLLVSISFFDFYTLPDERILLPIYPLLIIDVALLLSMYSSVVSIPVMLVFLALNLLNLPHLREEKSSMFSGYAAPGYASLRVLDYVRRLPDDAVIYSNAPDLIWYHTRKPASMLPRVIIPTERRKNPMFAMEMEEMMRRLKSGKGYIVWIAPVRRAYLPSIEELSRVIPVREAIRFPDGVILVVGNEGK